MEVNGWKIKPRKQTKHDSTDDTRFGSLCTKKYTDGTARAAARLLSQHQKFSCQQSTPRRNLHTYPYIAQDHRREAGRSKCLRIQFFSRVGRQKWYGTRFAWMFRRPPKYSRKWYQASPMGKAFDLSQRCSPIGVHKIFHWSHPWKWNACMN